MFATSATRSHASLGGACCVALAADVWRQPAHAHTHHCGAPRTSPTCRPARPQPLELPCHQRRGDRIALGWRPLGLAPAEDLPPGTWAVTPLMCAWALLAGAEHRRASPPRPPPPHSHAHSCRPCWPWLRRPTCRATPLASTCSSRPRCCCDLGCRTLALTTTLCPAPQTRRPPRPRASATPRRTTPRCCWRAGGSQLLSCSSPWGPSGTPLAAGWAPRAAWRMRCGGWGGGEGRVFAAAVVARGCWSGCG